MIRGPLDRLRLDEDFILGEDLVALQSALDGFEGGLGDANTCVVGPLEQADDRANPVPGHRASPFHHGGDAVE